MLDSFGRQISYMRISVTDRCNFRCRYCMGEKGVKSLSHNEILSFEEIIKIAKISSKLGIKKIRLTGGEPLVRRGFVNLCREIKKIKGIDEVAITTNGYLFSDFAEDIKEAGISRINFSLDTLDDEKFSFITGGAEFFKVKNAIIKALELGFKVKINTVLIGGFNDDEIGDFAELTKNNDIEVRFIELMKIGETSSWEKKRFIPNTIVLDKIPGLKFSSIENVTRKYVLEGHLGKIGLISPISSCFCSSCNRIRITSDGRLKPCLHSEEEIKLKGLDDMSLERALKEGIVGKPQKHMLFKDKSDSKRNMNQIGG